MGHKLILDVPAEVFEPLAETAKQRGATPEQLAVEWLATLGRSASRDPLEAFIGALRGPVPDWADRHDQYLGQALTDPGREAGEAEGWTENKRGRTNGDVAQFEGTTSS